MNTRTHQEYGFTLLELMLVIFLMGMTVSGVVMTLSSASGDNELKKEAMRFVGLIELVQEEAMLRSLEIGLVIDEQQYQFAFLNDKNTWQAFDDGSFFSTVVMPENITLSFELAGLKAENSFLGSKTLFEGDDSLFDNDEGLFGDKEEAVKLNPQIFIYSSGEVSDFSFTLSAFDSDTGTRSVTIKFNEFGELEIGIVGDA